MKIKTSELTGPALDWAVAKAEGLLDHISFNHEMTHPLVLGKVQVYGPSIFPALGWPIIDRERIHVYPHPDNTTWLAALKGAAFNAESSTSLIAAMRCYVASKLGAEVDIPEELLT